MPERTASKLYFNIQSSTVSFIGILLNVKGQFAITRRIPGTFSFHTCHSGRQCWKHGINVSAFTMNWEYAYMD